MIMGGSSRVEVIESKGCSKLFVGLSSSLAASSSFRGLQLQHFESMSTAASNSASVFGSNSTAIVRTTKGPFSGLVICVTGLSKEARRQVMDATERLGGQYSPDLHPQCTHLVVQSFGGRKCEHALKHGSKNGLFIVTLGWFVDSVRRNMRLSECLYSVKSVGEKGVRLDDLNQFIGASTAENSCLPVGASPCKQFDMDSRPYKPPTRNSDRSIKNSVFFHNTIYIDPDISEELQKKIYEAAAREGATFVDQWSVGCNVSHIVSEGASVQRYLGHANNIVTPPWVLKTVKEQEVQRLVHMSADLSRHISSMLENFHDTIGQKDTSKLYSPKPIHNFLKKSTLEERQQIVSAAKNAVRNRRNRRMQTCQTPIRPITPSSLLDSICWSISDPTCTASIYMDSLSSEEASEHQTPVFFDAKVDAQDSESAFANLTRPLTESEKTELIFKSHFLTILFPIDRFSEMGPSSRTYFSGNGFTCLQVLDHIHDFYQENMTAPEIEAAIHTDSRHADRLRALYCSKETMELGFVSFKRIDFLGSRKSFEMLKRVSGENNSNVYELLIRA